MRVASKIPCSKMPSAVSVGDPVALRRWRAFTFAARRAYCSGGKKSLKRGRGPGATTPRLSSSFFVASSFRAWRCLSVSMCCIEDDRESCRDSRCGGTVPLAAASTECSVRLIQRKGALHEAAHGTGASPPPPSTQAGCRAMFSNVPLLFSTELLRVVKLTVLLKARLYLEITERPLRGVRVRIAKLHLDMDKLPLEGMACRFWLVF